MFSELDFELRTSSLTRRVGTLTLRNGLIRFERTIQQTSQTMPQNNKSCLQAKKKYKLAYESCYTSELCWCRTRTKTLSFANLHQVRPKVKLYVRAGHNSASFSFLNLI